MTERRRGSLEMIASMTIAGTIGWFATESALPAVTVVFWRCLFALPCLALLAVQKGAFRPLTRSQLQLAALGGVAIVANWILLFEAFPKASISIATIVYNTQPFMLVGLAMLLLRERVPWSKLIWLSVAFIGVGAIIAAGPPANLPASDYLGGIALALAAAFGWAVAALTTRALRGSVAPELVAMIHVMVGAIFLVPFAAPATLSVRQWAIVATMGVIHTGLVYALMYRAVQRLPAYLQGTLSYVYPLVALLVDILAFHRSLSAAQLAGMTAVLVAAVMTSLGPEPIKSLLRRRNSDGAAVTGKEAQEGLLRR